MAIKKTAGGWQVDAQPGGRQGRRIRKSFKTKAEAIRFENWLKTQAVQGLEWNPAAKDNRRLSDLVKLWFSLHGQTLKDGEGRKKILLSLTSAMGNPYAVQFTAQDFTTYRATRLDAGLAPATMNREHAYLRSLFNELGRLGEWKGGNPLKNLRQIKVDDLELTWLSLEQLELLFTEIRKGRNKDTERVAKLALATGARWSEAETLQASQLQKNRVIFARTKSGRVRSVPIDPALAKELRTRDEGRLFSSCYSAFRSAIKRSGIELPPGQLTHVLRHTFASHFVMQGGHLLTLQRILGHSDIKMTMRYAHLAPEHLEEAIRLNPLALLTLG